MCYEGDLDGERGTSVGGVARTRALDGMSTFHLPGIIARCVDMYLYIFICGYMSCLGGLFIHRFGSYGEFACGCVGRSDAG